MLAGVKSQMSGWLSGGIPGLSRATGGGPPVEGEVPPPSDTAESQTSRESVQGSASEHVKDDDASRWVAGYVCVRCYGTTYINKLFNCRGTKQGRIFHTQTNLEGKRQKSTRNCTDFRYHFISVVFFFFFLLLLFSFFF